MTLNYADSLKLKEIGIENFIYDLIIELEGRANE